MYVIYEIKDYISDDVKNNISSKISEINTASVISITPFQIQVEQYEATRVLEILERENVRNEKK